MGYRRVFFSVVVVLSLPLCCPAQRSAPGRDPQALAVLRQALATAGGSAQLTSVQDFTASGSITYFWAGEEVQGPVTLRQRGTNQFRLDASLPEGTRSWLVSDGQGAVREPTGKTSNIPFSNSWNLGNLSLPHVGMGAAINDTSTSVVLVGEPTANGKRVYDVRLQSVFASKDDPGGELSKYTAKDYFIDTTTFTLVATQDVEYSNDAPLRSFEHQILFSDYRPVNGLMLPFSITETINGQETWSIQLSSITFNSGLTDSVFQF